MDPYEVAGMHGQSSRRGMVFARILGLAAEGDASSRQRKA
jgi:hypothetical protein